MSTVWRNVVEVIDKKPTFVGLTNKIITILQSMSRLLITDAVDNLVADFWLRLQHKDTRHYVVFEVKPGGGANSYQWLNSRNKSPLTQDEVIFATLRDLLELTTVQSGGGGGGSSGSNNKTTPKCVKCVIPIELKEWLSQLVLVWVHERDAKG